MIKYNVMFCDFNTGEPVLYDIMPYLYGEWKSRPYYFNGTEKIDHIDTVEKFREWLLHAARYQFWARCEYEFIMVRCPTDGEKPLKDEKTFKVDIFDQIEINIDFIAESMWNDICKNKTGKKRNRRK